MEVKKLKLPEQLPQEFEEAPAAFIMGDLPLPVGESIKPTRFTEAELKTLKQAGVKEGQAIPTNMAEILDAARRKEYPKEPVKAEVVDVSDLSDAHKAEIAEALRMVNTPKDASEVSPTLTQPGQTVEVVNDVVDKPVQDTTGSGANLHSEVCKHCGWNQNEEDIPDPSQDDRLWYLQAILGDCPFEKTLSLMDGAIKVTFRELSLPQSDAIYQQVGKEMKENEDSTMDNFVERVRRYRLALQLKTIQFSHLKVVEVPNDPKEVKSPSLPALLDVIFSELLTTITITNQVAKSLDRFNRLVAKLEACADRENFWPAA